jgi:hypothetical protein
MSDPKVLVLCPPERRFSASEKDAVTRGSSSADNSIRRPTRGITLRDDTYATLRVVAGSNTPIKVIDAGGRDESVTIDGGMQGTNIYSNFLLQNIVDDRQEKHQILETFGEPYIFLFGERPRIMGFQGVLINSKDFNWEAEWWANYDRFLRGTKCVENDAMVFLQFDNTIIGGYVLNANATKNAQERHWLQLQFNIFVTFYTTLTDLGNPSARTSEEASWISESGGAYSALFKPDMTFPPNERYTVDATGKVSFGGSAARSQTLFSSLADTFRKVQGVTNYVLNTANQIINGEVVRVPVGFEASFAYEDTTAQMKAEIEEAIADHGKAPVLKAGFFRDNEDEYVGGPSAYGIATDPDLSAPFAPRTVRSQFESGKVQAQQANDFWVQNGFNPGSRALQTIATAVTVVRYGLIAVGLVDVVHRYKAKDFVPDFTGGIIETLGGGTLGRWDSNEYDPDVYGDLGAEAASVKGLTSQQPDTYSDKTYPGIQGTLVAQEE